MIQYNKECSDIPAYKALQCINYQLEIPHLTEIRKLTTEEELAIELLNEITGEIAMKIVRRLPEYNKAGWSI